MKRTIGSLLAMAFFVSGCGDKAGSKVVEKGGEGAGNPLTAPVDYLGAVGRAKKSAERTIDLAGLNQAIQTFYGVEDRYPKDLQELMSQRYVPSLPTPPAGTRFVYDPVQGVVRVVKQ